MKYNKKVWGIMKKENLVRASIVMLVFSVISKISGFLREQVFAYYYGASNITDAYITATAISTTIFAGLTTAVTVGYIPTISLFKKDKTSIVTSNIINLSVIIITIISLIVLLAMEYILPFFAIGFTEQTRAITLQMAMIILPASFLYVVYNVLNGYLQFNDVFWATGISVVLTNVTNIILFIATSGSVDILAYGYVLSWVVGALFLLIVSRKNGYKHSCILKPNDEAIKSIVALGTPIFLGQLLLQLNTLIDRNFASLIGEGIMTSMKYANQLIVFVTTIFVVSIVTAIYPKLSKLASENNIDEYKKISLSSMKVILLFVLPISVAFFLLANPIVEIVFMRGEFDATSAMVTSNTLKAYAFAIPGICMNEILNKQFYSFKDTKTPFFLNAISFLLNVIFNLMVIKTLGYVGLALATAFASTVLAFMLYYKLNKKVSGFGTKKLMISASKMMFSSFVMGVSVWFVLLVLEPKFEMYNFVGNVVKIGSSAFIGAVVYFIFIYILKVEELKIATDMIKTKIFKNKA